MQKDLRLDSQEQRLRLLAVGDFEYQWLRMEATGSSANLRVKVTAYGDVDFSAFDFFTALLARSKENGG